MRFSRTPPTPKREDRSIPHQPQMARAEVSPGPVAKPLTPARRRTLSGRSVVFHRSQTLKARAGAIDCGDPGPICNQLTKVQEGLKHHQHTCLTKKSKGRGFPRPVVGAIRAPRF